MQLQEVVPWGRSLDEYRGMFTLSEADLRGRLLGCGGRAEGRYLVAALPKLPFNNGEFDLALCSHLLFLYSAQLSADFHLASMLEMLRVAQEVRVFPLLDLDLQRSVHLDPVIAELRSANFYAEIVDVPYIFQKGGGQMLRVVRSGERIERDPQTRKTSA